MKNFSLPGELTRVGWQPPETLDRDEWLQCGDWLATVESGSPWALGDWWRYSDNREWGKGRAIADEIGANYTTIRIYATVARAFELFNRLNNLTFKHHFYVMAVTGKTNAQTLAMRMKWLRLAVKGTDGKPWSANILRSKIAQALAYKRVRQIDFDAKALGKFSIIYADPPWKYEHPSMGVSNRSPEKQYPTMTLDQICAMPVADIAYKDALLLMWATNPQLYDSMKVLDAWGFAYKVNLAWIKDKIGMGYYLREQHELLLIARRGKFPPPMESVRPPSVLNAPRRGHSAKPPEVYDIIDRMYPKIRKIELFSRADKPRRYWTTWGNQAMQEAAE